MGWTLSDVEVIDRVRLTGQHLTGTVGWAECLIWELLYLPEQASLEGEGKTAMFE
jgi:hypothetical protein